MTCHLGGAKVANLDLDVVFPNKCSMTRLTEPHRNKNMLGLTNPVLTAYMTMAVLLTPNFAIMFLRWVVTV